MLYQPKFKVVGLATVVPVGGLALEDINEKSHEQVLIEKARETGLFLIAGSPGRTRIPLAAGLTAPRFFRQ